MGTRNLSICRKNNKEVIKQYGQWDGYPEGQGVTILEFCKKEGNLKKLEESLDKVVNISDYKEYLVEYNKVTTRWANDVDERTDEMKYEQKTLNSRDIGGEIFENIINIDHEKMPKQFKGKIPISIYESDEENFENYSDLWIEYAYVINFDTNTLDCYGYGKFLKSYPLDVLPDKEVFVAELCGSVDNGAFSQ